jgi:beta-lactamase class A
MKLNSRRIALGGSLSATVLSALLVALPALANSISSYGFDPQSDRLSFTTEDEVQPTAKLLSDPTRLVVDLPGVRLGHRKILKPLSGKYKSLRLGQFNKQAARLVVELDTPYGVDPNQIKIQPTSGRSWSVTLPEPNSSDRRSGPDEISLVIPRAPAEAIPTETFKSDSLNGSLSLGRELVWLKQRLAAVHSTYPVVRPGLFILDLATGDYAGLQSGKAFPAASVIKLPILIAFFQDIDAGKVSLTEKLTMRPELIASGSGYMQDLAPWSSFSSRYTVGKMIETSDNTATNMIIKRLGGASALNKRFRSWGLQDTAIRRWLPDLSGTNTVSPQDLSLILSKLAKGNLLSATSQAKAIAILKTCKTRTLLYPGIGPGGEIAHKTGDIGFAIGDAGIVYMPNGRQYIAAVMLKRPYDDPRGRDYIQTVSRITYSYFSQR